MLSKPIKKQVEKLIKNKIILVTGGTGSFGQTITKHLLEFNPKKIIIFSRTEDKQVTMMRQYHFDKRLRFQLGDVRDIDSLRRVMVDVDYVFHAAAQKQVPLTEYNVLEAVKTNILGAQNVIDVCLENNVKKAIAISTDKAAEPINAMGMTKALQEKLFIQANINQQTKKTIFSCVRYGNVIGSTGSVLPLFLNQIRTRQNLTVTHPEMTRFIITLDQAAELVFTALLYSIGGEVFIPDLPAHKITDLAEALLDVHVEKELKILETGIRVGEKIHETLITPVESLRTVKKKGFYIILPEIKTELVEKKYKKIKQNSLFRYSSDNAKIIGVQSLKKLILVSKLIQN